MPFKKYVFALRRGALKFSTVVSWAKKIKLLNHIIIWFLFPICIPGLFFIGSVIKSQILIATFRDIKLQHFMIFHDHERRCLISNCTELYLNCAGIIRVCRFRDIEYRKIFFWCRSAICHSSKFVTVQFSPFVPYVPFLSTPFGSISSLKFGKLQIRFHKKKYRMLV